MKNSSSKKWGFEISDMILLDHQAIHHSEISEKDRQTLVEVLEDAIVDFETMESLLCDVKRLSGGRFKHLQPKEDDWIHRILEEGLQILNNKELVHLLLNPVLLCQLKDEIGDQLPDYPTWWLPFERQGRRHIEEQSISPPFDEPNVSDVVELEASATMLGQDSSSQSKQRLRFRIHTNELKWISGKPTSMDEFVIVEIEKIEANKFSVSLGGILEPGVGVVTKIAWASSSGELIEERSPSTPFRLRTIFTNEDRQLLIEDILTVHYRSSPGENQSEVKLSVKIDKV